MLRRTSRFHVGQLVVHRRLRYRGVVVDVDPDYRETDAWCEQVAGAPAWRQPWYRILPDGSAHETYIAERELEADGRTARIRHPLVWHYFVDFRDGAYVPARPAN